MSISTDSDVNPGFDTLPGHELIKTIVLVDSPQITQPVGSFLRQTGWTVYEASNCGQARALIARFKPEFVIMELLLPLETGFEFCAYLKKASCRTAVMIFTEVYLEEARNMAMWAGADAYLTKPTEPIRLYQHILAAALRVSYRTQSIGGGHGGSILFRCKCGKSLQAGSQHAGRAIVCPGCRHLAICPESLLDSGTLYRTMMEERCGIRSTHTGIECPGCKRIIDPRKCRVRDHHECSYCGKHIQLSSDFYDQWLLFFSDESTESTATEFNPLRYVYVQCEECHNLHSYFRDSDSTMPCPSCGHQQSLPSIRGVPISRAALTSTGRLFEFRLDNGGSRLFLLPSKRKCTVGSSPDCDVTLQNQTLKSHHCTLKNTTSGPYLIAPADVAQILVNGQEIYSPMRLSPGDEIVLGEIQLRLHGTPETHLKKQISGLLTEMDERKRLIGELEFAEPAARILQYHWELQRLRWIENLQIQEPARSSRKKQQPEMQ